MNSDTTYEIGETLRNMSWQGNADYEPLAREAMGWFQRGTLLNPFDPYNYMRTGMCLDWLGQHDQAASYYAESVKRDPNNYYVLAHQGWHFVQVQDFATAKLWFERSYKLWWNPIAKSYLEIIERRLSETSSSK